MIFTDDLGNPEGPVLLPDGSWVVAEMHLDRGCITHITADGKQKRVIAKTGRPNGVTIDKNGMLWVVESMNPPSLLKVSLEGEIDIILTESEGKPFLFPNDLCFGPDGAIYMTDSGYSCAEWITFTPDQKKNASPNGKVFRIDPVSHNVEKLDDEIRFANGIAFGPDQQLYVTETLTGMIYRYQWQDGKIGKRQSFANVLDPEKEGSFRGPDGIAFGINGDLYAAVVWQGDITVLNPEGRLVRRIETDGLGPTNVAFGPSGSKKIYVTDQGIGQFEVFDVDTDGLPLYSCVVNVNHSDPRIGTCY